MKYIAHRRFKGNGICGIVNIPAMTELECYNGFITYKNGILCRENCETAHQYFARNSDGNGMERGKLTQSIIKTLSKRNGNDDRQYQERWDRVWNDPVCQLYKRADYDEYWLWNHDFFNANIDVLKYIAELVSTRA